MSAPQRRRTLIGVLALAGVGWAIDALLIRGGSAPRTAQAELVVAEATPVDARDVDTLIARLQRSSADAAPLPIDELQRNPFAPSETLRAQLAPASTVDAPDAPDAAARKTVQQFAAAHRLTGTLAGPQPTALIDGRVVRLGDAIDGFVVVEIAPGRVVLRRDEVAAVLTVPEPRP